MKELSLSQTALADSRNVLKLGKLLKADILLIIKPKELILFDSNLGIRLAQHKFEFTLNPQKIQYVINAIKKSCQKTTKLKNNQLLLLSMLPVRKIILNPEKQKLFEKFYELLQYKLINDEKIIIMEREHANELLFENKINNSILKSAALGLITGSNSINNSGFISARFFLKGINMDYFANIELDINSEKLDESIEKFYNMIVKNIKKSATTNVADEQKQLRNQTRELFYFYEEWQRAMKDKKYNIALQAINSAYIFDESLLKEKLQTEITLLVKSHYTYYSKKDERTSIRHFNRIKDMYMRSNIIEECEEKADMRRKALDCLVKIRSNVKKPQRIQQFMDVLVKECFDQANLPDSISSLLEYEKFSQSIKNSAKFGYIKDAFYSKHIIPYLLKFLKETDHKYFINKLFEISYNEKNKLNSIKYKVDFLPDSAIIHLSRSINIESFEQYLMLLKEMLKSKNKNINYSACKSLFQLSYYNVLYGENKKYSKEDLKRMIENHKKVSSLALNKYRELIKNCDNEFFYNNLKENTRTILFYNFGPYRKKFLELSKKHFKKEKKFQQYVDESKKLNAPRCYKRLRKPEIVPLIKKDFYCNDRKGRDDFSLFAKKIYFDIDYKKNRIGKVHFKNGKFYLLKEEEPFKKYILLEIDGKSGELKTVASIFDKINGRRTTFLFDNYFIIVTKEIMHIVPLDGGEIVKKKFFNNKFSLFFYNCIKKGNKIYMYYSTPRILGCYDIEKNEFIIIYSQTQEKNNIFINKKAPRKMLCFSEDAKSIVFRNYSFNIDKQTWTAIPDEEFNALYRKDHGTFPVKRDKYVFLNNYNKSKNDLSYFSFNKNRKRFFTIDGYKEGANFVQKVLYFDQKGRVMLALENKILLGQLKTQKDLWKLQSYTKREDLYYPVKNKLFGE